MTSTTDSSSSASFEILKSFFTERLAPAKALSHLREKVEIGIVLGGVVECALFRVGDKLHVESRRAENPDFIFRLSPETVAVLAKETPDDVAAIGLAVINQMLTGGIQVSMPGGWISVLRGGYLDIVKSGGAPVAKKLTQMGLASPTGILDLFKSLRR